MHSTNDGNSKKFVEDIQDIIENEKHQKPDVNTTLSLVCSDGINIEFVIHVILQTLFNTEDGFSKLSTHLEIKISEWLSLPEVSCFACTTSTRYTAFWVFLHSHVHWKADSR